ncbi:MAG TPA: Rrf2 family transcriptional regulator [Bacteroidetes bacterium]|nr:Rrf2 family transcriptional regulator [Bacteroidota bacterium]
MIFSRSTEYAIRAMVYLAVNSSPNRHFGVKKIAEEMGFPEHYLGKVLQLLARKNIISSVKGPNGGFCVDNEVMNISLLKIIDTMDGLEFFHTCGLGLHECNDEKPCPIHKDYQIFRGDLYKMLSEKTIRDMKADIENGIAFMDLTK